MTYAGASTALLLQVLREAKGTPVTGRELKERVGSHWREALNALRAEGYTVDEMIGNGGGRSFRLNLDEPPPRLLTEPAPTVPMSMPMTAYLHGKMVRVSLSSEDIRSLLCGTVTPTARDALVGGLMALTDDV